MFCYKCGTSVDKEEKCPVCGADLSVMQKAVRLSNSYYNDGLQKATVRNLSGAILSLKTSLKLYKYNTDARNLLGLVYYETGETVKALSEWVISKNYQPDDNPANRYLESIQENGAELEVINQTIKKYNQAINYCKADSRDLAMLQLRKVLSLNPNLVRAHQLLALLYIQEEKYDLAKKTLRAAGKIDTDNTTTLRYLKEVNARLKERNPNKKNKNDDLISYTNGNETIIMPKRFKETSVGATIAALVAGIFVGVLVTNFLILPAARSKYISEAKKTLVETNDSNTTKDTTISSLEKQIEELTSQLATEQGNTAAAQSMVSDYDKLVYAYNLFMTGDYVGAGEAISTINAAALSESSQSIYETFSSQVTPYYLATLYDAGYSAFYNWDYNLSAEKMQLVVNKDMTYSDGYAVFYLAESYRNLGNTDQAKTYYQYLVDNYPDTEKAYTAAQYLQ